MRFLLLASMILIPSYLFCQQRTNMAKIERSVKTSILKSQRNACGFDGLMGKLRENASFKSKEEGINLKILSRQQLDEDTLITLPVVVHIVHTNPDTISDTFIYGLVAGINNAFNKEGNFSSSTGVNTNIKFCLAKTDPNGGITTGITRTTHYFSESLNVHIEDRRLKNLIQWPPDSYINIWYIKSMELWAYNDMNCGDWITLKGQAYATFPGGDPVVDGIVTTTDLAATNAHEMGHYLSLYHTWEGFCQNDDCTTQGDRVCDTPPDGSVLGNPCNYPTNTCKTDTLSGFSTDQLDLTENLMDYGNTSCHNMFTQGQKDRMRAAIYTARPGLLINKCNKPCNENIQADFSVSNFYPSPGSSVNFVNLSSGATNYEWLIDDVQMSTNPNFTHTFNSIGKFKVVLKAYNADQSCFSSYIKYVHVRCGVTARFYPNRTSIASTLPLFPDSILFRNISKNASQYEWWIKNNVGMNWQMVATSDHLTYTFPVAGIYSVKLVAKNGSCVDTTEAQDIEVLNATPIYRTHLNLSICDKDSIFLQGQWQLTAGVYYDTLQSSYQCDSIIISHLTIHPLPTPNLGLDTSLCFGTNTILDPGNFVHYLWQNGDTSSTFTANATGTYIVYVTDQNNCKNADTLVIKQILPLDNCFLYALPNAFTPNGDGLNDFLTPLVTQKVSNYQFSVFNRWGKLMFSSTKTNTGWDGKYKGKLQPIGAYVYHIRFIDFENKPHFYKGSILLIL